MTRMTRRLAALTALATLVLVPAATAATAAPVFGLRAAGNPKLGYFVYEIAPGGTHTGAVIVSNTGTRTGSVKLYAADAGTGSTTGTVYLTDKAATGAGSWVHLASSKLTIAPGGFRKVPFTVRVPAGAKPGQWVAGIVAETSGQSTTKRTTHKAGVQIHIRNQTIVAVQVDVPGRVVAGFDIGDVKPGGQHGFQQLLVHLANSGNQLQKPTGSVTIRKNAVVLQTLPFTMDTFLPATAIDYPLLLKKALPPGDYQAQVSVNYVGAGGATKTIVAADPFTVTKANVKQVFSSAAPTQKPAGGVTASSGSSTPWALIGGGIAALLLLALLVLFLLRRRRGARSEPDQGVPPERVAAAAAAPAAAEHARPAEPTEEPSEEPAEPPQPEPETWREPAWGGDAQPAPPAPAPVAAGPPRGEACRPYHYWEVAYERGTLGDDGVWRFPHRCRNCGLELLATDIADASAQADTISPP